MKPNCYSYDKLKTLDIKSKNDEKVFIKIPLESGGFWQKEYFQNDQIENVINDFKTENHVDIPQDCFLDWHFNNRTLKMTDKLKTLINQEIPTVCINKVIKKKPLKLSKEEIITDVVGKPFNNPFEVIIFRKKDKSLNIQTYDPSTINNLFLNNYSPSSSYCNGNNHLFISGGEKTNGEIIDDFWEIDLNEQNIAEPVKIPPKKNHSMIFIPNNYVFVVGGNDKKTFYFNTENAEVCEWANLNNIRTEPGLQRLSNYLYCFDNVNKDIFTVEKTDLNSHIPKWTLITPKIDYPLGQEQKLSQKFFGVSNDKENNIMFLGGNVDNDSNGSNEVFNYKYNTNSDSVEISKLPYHKFNFKEKTFLPYKEDVDFLLTDFNKQNPEVVLYLKDKNKIEVINYDPQFIYKLRSVKSSFSDFKNDLNMPIQDDNILRNKKANNKIEQSDLKVPQIEPVKQDITPIVEIPKNEIIENKKLESIIMINSPKTYNDLKNVDLKGDVCLSGTIIGNKKGISNGKYKTGAIKNTKIPDFNISGNIPGKKQNNNNIPKNPQMRNNYINNNDTGNLDSTVNIDLDTKLKYPNNNENNIMYTSQVNMPPTKVKLNKDYNMSGVIQGTKPNQNKQINPNYKNMKKIPDFNISGNIPGTGLKNQKINTSLNLNKKDNYFSGVIEGKNIKSQVVEVPIGNINLQGSKIYAKNPNIKEGTIDVSIPDNNTDNNIRLTGPKIEIKSNNNIENNNTEYNGKRKINIPNYDMSGTIQGTQPYKPNDNKNNMNLTGTIYGHKLNEPKKQVINIDNNISNVEVKNSIINIPSSKLEPKDLNISNNIENLNIVPQNIEKSRNYDIMGTIPDTTKKDNENQNPSTNVTDLKNKTNNYFISGVIPPAVKYEINKKNQNNKNIKIQKSSNDFYPSNTDTNLQTSYFNIKIDNNLENHFEYNTEYNDTKNFNNNYIIRDEDISNRTNNNK